MSFEGPTNEESEQIKEAAKKEEPVLKRKKTEMKPKTQK